MSEAVVHLRPLPEYMGYVLTLGLGGVFTVLVWVMARFKGETAEEMLSGGRDIGHGMSNLAIVATWVWAATLMMSSFTGYSYGPSGPWWYSLGATLPLPAFAYLGQTLKVKMPLVHSYPEFILFRCDKKNHICQAVFSMIVCSWVTIMIVSGGSIMYETYTGLNWNVVATLMYISFLMYTLVAGVWASIFADTVMGLMIYVCLMIVVFGTLILVGPVEIWRGLTEVYVAHPVLRPFGAYANEFWQTNQWDNINYLGAAAFGFLITNSVGNLGAVLNNQTYWSIAIAADRPRTVWTSYMAGALCWAPIPLAMATSRGVLGNAWHVVVGETYTAVGGVGSIYFQEAEAVAPVTAFVLLGYLGLVAFFTAVSAATVSTGSHELMSAATNWTNDLYRYYIKPKATAKELLMMTRLSLVGLAVVNLAITILWRWLGFTFAAMYNAMGIAFSSAVIPLCLAVWWKKANNDGLFWGTVLGAILGIAYWTWSGFDLGWPCVWANLIVMGVSLIAIPWSWAKPANFDYSTMAKVDIIIHEE